MNTDHAVPTVTLDELTPELVVAFDIARLERIERAMDRGITDIFGDFTKLIPTGIEPGKPLSPEQAADMARRARWSVMAPFVAACLDVPSAELGRKVPLREMWPVFFKLFGTLGEALTQLNGGGEDAPPSPTPAPAPQGAGASDGSGPGPE